MSTTIPSKSKRSLVRLLGNVAVAAVLSMTTRHALGAEPSAARPLNRPADFAELTPEQLMNIKVTSPTKHAESLFSSATAIHVLTEEDIDRSGANSIADALRNSPGLSVARMDSHTWAITSRGFNSELASKLLVLMDGRSVYTPLNAGVYWDAQDTVLEDIDRIEVIRGSGGTLWGANAVNGVINITTKSARETQGLLASGGGGNLERAFGSVRYGGQLGSNAYYRVYGKFTDRDDFKLTTGGDAGDSWRKEQGGFRVDWYPAEENHLTLQGDLYEGREHQTRTTALPLPQFFETVNYNDRFAGQNVLGRWTREFSPESELKVQLYYDRTERENAVPLESRQMVDFDAQHRFGLGSIQEITWGLGYRWTGDRMRTNFALGFDSTTRDVHLFSSFVQDEITLIQDRVHLTIGSKFEHNDYTGFEAQPSARLSWTPNERQTLWAAVSRAVRTPSRAEDDVSILRPAGVGIYAGLRGDPSQRSEDLMAYELGYRVIPCKQFSLDIAAFYNEYRHLRTVEPGATLAPAVATLYSASLLKGESYGTEVSAKTQIADWWQWSANYTYLRIFVHPAGIGAFPTESLFEGGDPQHQFALRSMIDLPGDVQFDSTMSYVDNLKATGVPSYVALDLRIAWRPTKNVELALIGQSLLDNQHPESVPISNTAPRTEVPRSIFGKLSIRF